MRSGFFYESALTIRLLIFKKTIVVIFKKYAIFQELTRFLFRKLTFCLVKKDKIRLFSAQKSNFLGSIKNFDDVMV
ncbi:hypothetical protein C0971_16530 [Bacillus methanolicus]|nr:hypothetical protein C0971_16530 [Bacillus methanolicus]